MCNARPVLRIGRSLDIKLFYSTPDDEACQQSWLDVDDAPRIAKEAYRNLPNIVERIENAISQGFVGAQKYEAENAKPKNLSNDRGLILDFPQLDFRTEHFHHRIGLSLTVCMPNSRSKLWFRSQCQDIRRNDAFEPAIELTYSDLESFFDEASCIGRVALPALSSAYQAAVQDTLAETMANLQVDLRPAKEFRFKVFDTDGSQFPGRAGLETFLGDLEHGTSFTGRLQDFVATGLREHPALMAVRLNAFMGADDADMIRKLQSHRRDVRVIGHRNSDEQPGVFISRETVGGELPTVTFSGFAVDPKAGDAQRDLGHTPSIRLTAEMLAGLVRQYDAQSIRQSA